MYLVRHLSIIIVSLVVFLLTYLVGNCAHVVGGSSGLKCSTIGIGFNGAETNCGIAHILSILLMNSYDIISLFQALRWWGRRESERHTKSWRGGKKKRWDREREPVIISFTTFFRPLVARLR